MTPSPIEWGDWKPELDVEAWQAVLLSVGINPNDKELNLSDTLANDREVKRRLERMLSDLAKPEFFSVVKANSADPTCSQVILEEAAAWFIQSRPPLGDISPRLCSIGERLVYARQEAQKKHHGRYTVEEAAEKLEAQAGERFDEMVRKLKEAVSKGSLQVYPPGSNARREYGSGKASQVHEFYEEAYWSDLNNWLEKHEPRIPFRFPAPNATTSIPIGSARTKSNADGKTKRRRQIDAIKQVIQELNIKPLAIPDGGKQDIRAACKQKHSQLFGSGDDPFNDAWKLAVRDGEIRMKNHDKYSKRK